MIFNVICTIVFFTLFIGFFVWLIWISKKGVGPLHSRIVLVFVFGGGFLLSLAGWLRPLIITWNYVKVDAEIIDVEPIHMRSNESDYDYNVTFQYTYNGKEYKGLICYEDDAQIPDKHTKLKCNPDNPTQLANFSLFWLAIVVSVIFGTLDYFFIKDLIYYIKNRNNEEDSDYDSEIQSD